MVSPEVSCEEYYIKEERIDYLDEVKEELALESRRIVFENETIKCGEVMVGYEGEFTFICVLCTQNFINLHSFGSHIKDYHFNHNALSTIPMEKDQRSSDSPWEERGTISIPPQCETKPDSPPLVPLTEPNSTKKQLEITCLETVASSDRKINEASRDEFSSCEESNPVTASSDSCKVGKYVCTFCGCSYLARSSYMRHMKRKHPEQVAEQKICKYCDKEFEDLVQLETHVCTRKGRMRYVCPYCPKVFHNRQNRHDHVNIHTTERPFKCSQCPKMFADLKYLEKHERAHLGSHTIDSDLCQNALSTISTEQDGNSDPLGTQGSSISISPQREDNPESLLLVPTSAPNPIQKDLETAIHDTVDFSDNGNEEASKNDGSSCKENTPVTIFLNSTKIEEFACTFCGCSYHAKSSLSRHIKKMHPEYAPVQKICIYCDKEFDDSVQLKAHVRTHTGFKRFVCPFCPKVFDTRSSRQEHINVHTGERPFQCGLCPKTFKQKSNLMNHKRKCHKKLNQRASKPIQNELEDCNDNACSKDDASSCKESTPVATFLNCAKVGEYGCGYCGHSYKAKSSYRRHMKKDHPNIKEEAWVCIENDSFIGEENSPGASFSDSIKVGEFVCKLCGRSYNASNSYRRHMKEKHPGGKEGAEQAPEQLICKYCYKKFNDVIQYTTHVLAHTERKRYVCPFCPKVFATKHCCQSHINTHTGERPFKCSLCPKAFAHATNLDRHKRSHLKIKNYVCDYCGKCFGQSVEKKLHERTHTGEKPYQCEECGQRFICHSRLMEHCRKHKNIKPFVCKVCGRAFISARRLRGHSVMHKNERPHHCNVCGKSFPRLKALRAHQQLHSEEKKYVCNICGAAFAQCAGLYSHRKSHGERM